MGLIEAVGGWRMMKCYRAIKGYLGRMGAKEGDVGGACTG